MGKSNICLIVFIIIVIGTTFYSEAAADYVWLSSINNVSQKCPNLCWAACIEMITGEAQCCQLQYSYALGGPGWPNCCEPGFLCDICNYKNFLYAEPGSVCDIFIQHYEIIAHFDNSIFHERISTALNNGYPIIINDSRIDGGHMMVITGYNTDFCEFVLRYNDPGSYSPYTDGLYHIVTDSGNMENLVVLKRYISITFLSHFTPYLTGNGVSVDFETTFEENTSHFLLQRSSKGFDDFRTIDTIKAEGTGTKYTYTDVEGSIGDFYRLIEVENTGMRHLLESSRVFDQKPNWEFTKTKSTRRDIESIREETRSIIQRKAGLLKAPAAPADPNYEWLAIYPDSFESDVANLIQWRFLNGLSAHGTSIEEIEDSNYTSINDYIQDLWDTQNGSLEYVCLVGGACISGHPEYNIIPIDTFDDGAPNGAGSSIYTSDFEVGDVNGDGYPEISVGRIPAEEIYDVASYIGKVIIYENTTPGAWKNEVTYFIDAENHNSCSGALANNYAEDLKGFLPIDYNLHYMFSNDSTYTDSLNFPPSGLTYCEMQSKAIDEFNEGRSLVLGFGNAGNPWNDVMWTHTHFHHNCDGRFCCDSLTTNMIYPFFIGATCEIGNLVHHVDSLPRPLVKELMFDSQRGIIGAFGPSGGSYLTGNYKISKYTLQQLYEFGAKSAGYACMNAQKMVMEEGDIYDSTARSYIYFGDPAIKLNFSSIPGCDSISLADNYLTVCPAGDADSIVVHIDFIDSAMTADIDKSELWLIKPSDNDIAFFAGDTIYADSSATSLNNWHTTITNGFIGGHCQDTLLVGLNEYALERLLVTIKSPDYDADGEVGLTDLGVFGTCYGSCVGDSLYDDWCDFNSDSCVSLGDYGVFATHYGHEYVEPLGAMLAGADIVSNMEVELNISDNVTAEGVLETEIVIKNGVDYSVLAIMLQINNKDISFIQWQSEEKYAEKTATVSVNRDGKECIFIADFGTPKESGSISSSKMGTLAFKVLSAGKKAVTEEDISILFCEFLTKDGKTAILKGMNINSRKDITYTDRLANNFPNPFNPTTMIKFSISRDSHVALSIYDVSGRLIKTLVDGVKKKNNYSIKWHGKDNKGRPVASGVYFYRLKTEHFTKSRKMVLLR